MQSIRDMMAQQDLLRPIDKVHAYTLTGDRVETIPDVFALRHRGAELAMRGVAVGARYTVLQNADLADMADQAAAALKLAGVPAVRTWHDGARVSVILPLDRFGVGIGRGDVTEARLRIDNPHGGGSSVVALDLFRLICANGMVRRIGGSRSTIPHTASVTERVRRLVLAAGHVRALLAEEATVSQRLADRALSQAELGAFLQEVHRRAYGPLTSPEGAPREAAVQRVAQWVRNLDDDRQRVAGVQGTAWAAVQAIVQWADHEAPVRGEVTRRLASADHGPLARVKVRAMDVARELLAR